MVSNFSDNYYATITNTTTGQDNEEVELLSNAFYWVDSIYYDSTITLKNL